MPCLAEDTCYARTILVLMRTKHLVACLLPKTTCGESHLPTPLQILDINQWGPLASAGMGQGITNERAIIMIAHVHVLVVSVIAAFAPFAFQVCPCHPSPESLHLSPSLFRL